jgi:hypothetical protein
LQFTYQLYLNKAANSKQFYLLCQTTRIVYRRTRLAATDVRREVP